MKSDRVAQLVANRERRDANGAGTEQDNDDVIESGPSGGPPTSPSDKATIDLTTEALRFVSITEADGDITRMGYWVPCTLPMYKGLSVLYRTNNATSVRLDRPDPERSKEWRIEERKRADLERALMAEKDPVQVERLSERLLEQTKLCLKLTEAHNKAFHNAQCEWLAEFVIDFSPWPFKGIEKPDPADPTTYHVLHDKLEDLYRWLMPGTGGGYERALAASTKNS